MELSIHWISVVKVLVAIGLGGLIGLEREVAGKPAGLRTHMLVSGAAALFVILGELMIYNYSGTIAEVIQADPIRIMEAIITGISFLGAGTIIFRNKKHTVEGLTTAASILFVSGIGITVALGEYGLAVLLTVLVIIVLQLLYFLEKWIEKIRSQRS